MSGLKPEEVTLEWYRATTQVTRELGLFAIRTLIALNSGAFVVLLTFLGNAAAQTAYVLPLAAIQMAMYCFLGGITAAALVVAVAYVAAANANPYKVAEARWDWLLITVYILFSTSSLALFVLGVLTIVNKVEAP